MNGNAQLPCVFRTGYFPRSAPLPSATTATMPSITGTVGSQMPPVQPALTVTSLLQRMPQIVNPAPAEATVPACTSGFEQWVADHPLLAAAALGLAAFLIFREKK